MTRRRRKYRKKKNREHGEVELNMAAMLDMAFQLLAFFILTFKPSPVESQIALRLPIEQVTQPANASVDMGISEDDDLKENVPIELRSTEDGELTQITVGARSISGNLEEMLQGLGRILTELVGNEMVNGVTIRTDERLNYERLMQVVDLCSRQKSSSGAPLTKIAVTPLKR